VPPPGHAARATGVGPESRARVAGRVAQRRASASPRADDGIRTRLVFVGIEVPRQAASSAVVPPVGLEPTHFRVRIGCSALELRRQCSGDASANGHCCMTCHPLESNQDLPGFSRARRPSTQEWHREAWVRLADHPIQLSNAPSAPCRWRSTVSVCSGNRRCTCAAVGRGPG
jgi:hypothetical protein